MNRLLTLLVAVVLALSIAGSAGAAPNKDHASCEATFATLGRDNDQHISWLATHDHPGEPSDVGRVARTCHYIPGGG